MTWQTSVRLKLVNARLLVSFFLCFVICLNWSGPYTLHIWLHQVGVFSISPIRMVMHLPCISIYSQRRLSKIKHSALPCVMCPLLSVYVTSSILSLKTHPESRPARTVVYMELLARCLSFEHTKKIWERRFPLVTHSVHNGVSLHLLSPRLTLLYNARKCKSTDLYNVSCGLSMPCQSA